jgi:site-specific DNA-methyltransferase (adenine-specific)
MITNEVFAMETQRSQVFNFEMDISPLLNRVIVGDCVDVLKTFPSDSIDLVITSPPYFQQREYGGGGIGNESSVEDYINNLLDIFNECVRVIKKTGTIVINLGDKYIDGNLLLVPYRFAIEAQKRKEIRLINELTWVKVNPVPKQNPKKLTPSTEPFFIFAKSDDYYFDKDAFLEYRDLYFNGSKKKPGNDVGKKYFELIEKSDLSKEEKEKAVKELNEVIMEVMQGKIESFRMKIRGLHALPYGGQAGGRLTQIENKGFTIIRIFGHSIRKDVIETNVETLKGNIHPAVYPEFIVQELLKLLTKENDIVLDPFLGSGTTAVVAQRLRRNYIGIEIHPEFVEYAQNRLAENSNNNTFELFI